MKIPIALVVWLLLINLIGAVVVAWDKARARNGRWRIPERTLWLFAALGGAAAMWMACVFMHHKTRYFRFMWGLPMLALVQAILVYILVVNNVFDFTEILYTY